LHEHELQSVNDTTKLDKEKFIKLVKEKLGEYV
jgi:hypothetical protein